MIALSTEPVAWTPKWLEGQDGAPRFLFRPPSRIDRMNFEAVLAGEFRAGLVYDFELAAAFEAGLDALLSDSEELEQVKALIAAEAELKAGETLPSAEAAALAAVRETLSEAWPAYRNLVAQTERRRTIVPVLAFKRFCVGWEGEGLPPFKRGLDGQVASEAMDGLEEILLQVAGRYANGLQSGRGLEKNSPPPSKPGGSPKPSLSPRPRAGKSTASTGT